MNKRLWIGCASALVIFIVLAYFGIRKLGNKPPKAEISETAQIGDVEMKVVENGTIIPRRRVEIKSKVEGKISRLFVEVSDKVVTGQPLVLIDPQEINSQVAALQAQLDGARARLESSRQAAIYQKNQTTTGMEQFRQNMFSAEARWKQAQAESGAQPDLTRQAIDIASANLEAAKANLKVQQDSLQLMLKSTHPQTIASLQSTYDQAKAQAVNARRNLERQKQLLAKGFVPQRDVDTAETDLMVTEARLREAKVGVDRIKQANALEEANARSQIASAESQVRQNEAALAQAKTGVLPFTRKRELESARAAYQQARAQYTAAIASKSQDAARDADTSAAATEVVRLQNQLNELVVRQKGTTVISPMEGIVTARNMNEGELVASATSAFSSGQTILQIEDPTSLSVEVMVNEVDIAKVKKGLTAEVSIDGSQGVIFPGHVSIVSPASQSRTADASSSASTSSQGGVTRFKVKVDLDKADPRLRSGMTARCVILMTRKKSVLRLPINCVQIAGEKGTVQIVTETMKDGQKVETTTPREVVIGLRGDEFVEIASGLKQGEKVRPNAFNGPKRKTIDPFGNEDGNNGGNNGGNRN